MAHPKATLAGAAVWLLVSLVAAGQTPTIRVPVRLVSVPTLVASAGGKYVAGLSAADIQLKDKGRVGIHVDADPLPIAVVAVVCHAFRRAGQVSKGTDPFSVLTIGTGGPELPVRKQKQLEDGIIAIGDALRSRYMLSFTPDELESGFRAITVRVDVPGAKVYTRPGYLAQ